MEAAINEARQTIQQFIDAFVYPAANQRSFLLKAAFGGDGFKEHVWMADLKLVEGQFEGVIANETKIPSLKFMSKAWFSPAQVTDWMYVEDGFLVGGYTTKLIRSRMGETEKSQYDARAPFKFR